MQRRLNDGASLASHRASAERQLGRSLAGGIVLPAMPPLAALYLWRAYIEARPRVGNGFGLAELSWAEIEAWSIATSSPMTPWEKRMLREIHGVALRVASETASSSPSKPDDDDSTPLPKRRNRDAGSTR